MSYWVKFKDGSKACVEGPNPEENAAKVTGKEVVECDYIPYPAYPQIGEKSNCPPFCTTPDNCKGSNACPKPYACTE